MKAKLTFNLPDDEHEFQMAIKGAAMHSVLWEMDQWLRTQYKYMSDTEHSEDKYDTFVKCREQLKEFMNDENINFD
tara:strand:+ start:1281 stop:1508 length:228 start_codon:yes stop_codon:yes gene_type:complete